MSAWDMPAPSQPGASSGTPTVINVSLQAGAAFHLHQEGGGSTTWAVEQVPTIAPQLPATLGRAALPDAPRRLGSSLGAV
eukprot:3749004-Alexandrium_andersonii.AAC.1